MEVEGRYSMAVEFQSSEKDDSDFIRLVSSIVEHTINQIRPVEVFIIQIDNWFDHKWLEFSGKGIVYFDSSGLRGSVDAALDEFRQDKITFPPFTPNRVIGQRYFFQNNLSEYVEGQTPKPIYKSERQQSTNNLHRRISDFTDSGIFVWYSSNTLANQKGSLMVYTVTTHGVATWFASFRKRETWKLDSTKGIYRDQLQDFVNQL